MCIEKRGSLGGTCLNVGCIPSKALLNSTHKFHEAQHEFKKHGINFDGLSFDFGQIQKQKEKAVTGLTKGVEGLLKKNKVDYLKGWGRFDGPNQITVDLNDGKTQTIKAKNVIIATGSEPSPMPGNVLSIDEKTVVSSTGALALQAPPKKMVVVGAGYIGLEMGSVYARLGTEVTVVEFLDRLIPAMDTEVTKMFKRILEKQGLKFMLSTKVTGGALTANGAQLTVEPSEGGAKKTIDTDVVLVATGRRPFTEGLGLDKVGL